MFRSKGRFLACIALASYVAVASWGCCTAEKAAGVVLVAVPSKVKGQQDGSKPAKPTIYCSKGQQLIWTAPPGEKLTQIIIHLGGNPTPFKYCTSGADPCVIQCNQGVCVSGVFAGIKCPDKDLYYDYDAVLAASGQADPGFIIRP